MGDVRHVKWVRRRRSRPSTLAVVAACACAATAAARDLHWPQIEALERAGRLEAALARLPPAADPLRQDALQIASTRQRLLNRLGRYAAAQRAGRDRLALAERLGDVRQQVEAKRHLARSLQGLDRDAPALALLRRAAVRLKAVHDPELEADLLLDLAFSLANSGEYEEAETVLRRAEAVCAGTQSRRLLARLWSTWATLRYYQDDTLTALELRDRALEAAEEVGERDLLATSLSNLAQSSMQAHDYARAVDLLERALALDPPLRQRIITLVSAGICHLELGQLSEAEARFESARQTAAAAGNRRLEGWALGELGLVAWKRRQADRALELLARAADVARSVRDVRNERVWIQNMGMVRRDQGRFEEALALYRQVEHLERQKPGRRPNHNLRKHVGQSLAGLGRLREAEAQFEEALHLATGAGDTKVVWETQRERAQLLRRTGRPVEAMAAYEGSLAGIESIRRALRLETFKADFFETKVGVYAEVVDFVLEAGGPAAAGRAFELTERARARAFLDSLAESRARPEGTLPAELAEAERRILAEISRVQAALRRNDDDPEAADGLARQERALQALHLRVRHEFPRFQHLRHPEPARLADVQAALPAGTVLLAYFLAEPRSHLWVVRQDGIVHHALPGERQIEEAVRAAYAGFLDPSTEPRLEGLGNLLLDAVDRDPAPAAIVLVPSGILHALPFEALPMGGRTLATIAPTSYLPSASALQELVRSEAATPRRLLVVADAAYEGGTSAERAAVLSGLRRLGTLPHSRGEAQAIAGLFGGGGATLLLGKDALEGRLKAEDLQAYSVLHFATHGWIDPTSSARSAVVLGAEQGPEDGLLQFREILRLPLRADLVTLSACQTALGEMVTGEGMVGLFRAFLYAGSSSVVASLWNVNDEASAEFMRHFYRELGRGRSKGDALRRARLELRHDPRYRHPYYWAPFILIGRADDTVQVRARWTPSDVAWLLATAALAAGTAVWFRRRVRRTVAAASGA